MTLSSIYNLHTHLYTAELHCFSMQAKQASKREIVVFES